MTLSLPGRIHLSVRVSPGSGRSCVEGVLEDGSVKVSLRSPPSDGRANRELITLLADEFGTDKSSVSVVSGGGGRRKLVRVESPSRIPSWFDEEENRAPTSR